MDAEEMERKFGTNISTSKTESWSSQRLWSGKSRSSANTEAKMIGLEILQCPLGVGRVSN